MPEHRSLERRTMDYQTQYIEHNRRLTNGKSCPDECAVCLKWRREAAGTKPAAKVALSPDVLSPYDC